MNLKVCDAARTRSSEVSESAVPLSWRKKELSLREKEMTQVTETGLQAVQLFFREQRGAFLER